MARVTFVVRTTLPDVPVTVKVYEPDATLLLVLMVSTELAEPEIDEGLNLPVTDFGKPLTANLIVPDPRLPVAATV